LTYSEQQKESILTVCDPTLAVILPVGIGRRGVRRVRPTLNAVSICSTHKKTDTHVASTTGRTGGRRSGVVVKSGPILVTKLLIKATMPKVSIC
jgi:hypothetical protein